MDDVGTAVKEMAARDRLSIDLDDLKPRIESCKTDLAWKELGLAQKIRVLLRMALEQLEKEFPYETTADLVTKNWDRLADYNRIDSKRLDAIAKGDRPNELETARLALALGMDEAYIEQLATKKK